MRIYKKRSGETVWGKHKREDMGTCGYVKHAIYMCMKF